MNNRAVPLPTKHPFSACLPPISFNLRSRAYLRLTKAATRLNWSESLKKWRTCSCGDFLISQYSYSSISIVIIVSRSYRIFVDIIHLVHLVYSFSYIHHIFVCIFVHSYISLPTVHNNNMDGSLLLYYNAGRLAEDEAEQSQKSIHLAEVKSAELTQNKLLNHQRDNCHNSPQQRPGISS